MRTILFCDVVDDYVAKPAPLRAAHLELGRQARARGELLLAGAFAKPADGVVLVFRGRIARRRGGIHESGCLREEWAGQGLAGKKMEGGD